MAQTQEPDDPADDELDPGLLYFRELVRILGSEDAVHRAAEAAAPFLDWSPQQLQSQATADQQDHVRTWRRAHDLADQVATGTIMMAGFKELGLIAEPVEGSPDWGPGPGRLQ